MANKALEILRDRLSEDSVEISYDNIDGINTLRLVLDSIGEADDGIVVLELSDIPLEEQSDYAYYHFISVLANNIEAEQIADTLVDTLMDTSVAHSRIHRWIINKNIRMI